jgi:hypothetical protein
MRMCAEHWADLRSAIDERGLPGLVHQSGEAAFSIKLQLRSESGKPDFDPLLNANFAIYATFLQEAGLSGLIGSVCPLCEVERGQAGLAANWINGAADDQLQRARQLGLAPAVQ